MIGTYRTIVAAAALAASTLAPAAASSDATQIADLLARSSQAWNRGDLATFMRSYENAPTTEYVSSKTVIRGYAAIRAHYAAHYGSTGMPILSISDLDVRPLGSTFAVVVAHWHLAMADGTHPTGIFSLVLHRSPGGWHIITDHSP
jgi:ketosteroid isomerase-like protein